MGNICENYSGVVINQNQAPTASLAVSKVWYYQTFRLPGNYRRGSEGKEYRWPDLSGFQLMTSITSGEAATASLEYTLDWFLTGTGWVNLAKGTVKGAHVDGEKLWMDVIFGKSVKVTEELTKQLLRVGFNPGTGIKAVWFSQPNPLNQNQEALEGEKVLLNGGTKYSFNFRVLGLVADSGTDHLGNSYRSIAVESTAEDANTNEGTKPGYWLSAPMPSQFAVANMYFDVRPFPGVKYGTTNPIPNPSAEYDPQGAQPAGWRTTSSYLIDGGASASVFKGKPYASASQIFGVNSYFIIKPKGVTTQEGATTEEVIPVVEGVPITVWVSLYEEIEGAEVHLHLGSAECGNATIFVTQKHPTEWKRHSVTLTPTKTGYVAFAVSNGNASTNQILFAAVSPFEKSFVDGDTLNWEWVGQKGNSASVEVIKPTGPEEGQAVIDGVMIDPITPGVAFNVYYSNDGTANEETTDAEWDNKLWTPVPQTYEMNHRQEYVFPEPIHAEFIKVEFSHLQPRVYDPGDYQAPVIYKRFPTWVHDFFISNAGRHWFIAKNVSVTFDALELLYKYHLDDLTQGPVIPPSSVDVETEDARQAFAQTFTGKADGETLSKLKFSIEPFNEPPGARADSDSMIGAAAKAAALSATSYPVEKRFTPITDVSLVSSRNRDFIVREKTMPRMFFWLTCRHGYKEVAAEFDHNRAYFAGVNELAFLRHDYTTTYDGELYIESGGDAQNAELNDFVINEDNDWTVY